nr:hypothetical protein [Secundilactobacillus kimchicus]
MSREIVLVTTNLALMSQLQQALNPRQMTIQSRFDPQLKSVGRQLTLIIDLAAHFAYGQLADQLREFRRSAGGPVIGYLPNELVATASMADLFTTYQLDEVLTEKMTTDEWVARIRQKEWVYAQLNLIDQPSRLTVGIYELIRVSFECGIGGCNCQSANASTDYCYFSFNTKTLYYHAHSWPKGSGGVTGGQPCGRWMHTLVGYGSSSRMILSILSCYELSAASVTF